MGAERTGAQPPAWIPPSPPRRSSRGRTVATIALIVVIAVAGGGLVVAWRDDGPDYPASWDPRITELVEYAQDARDLKFKHPVHVDFLDEAAFVETLQPDETELDDDAQRQQDESDRQAVGYFRAIGLLEGDVELRAEAQELADAGTLAYYDPGAERVVIRGTTLDLATQVTVVHELVHVLQDQHFDLSALTEEAEAESWVDPDGIIEGDARRIEYEFVDDLSSDEQEEYEAQSADDGDPDALDEVPLILRLIRAAPYETGSQFVSILAADDGNRSVDAAFTTPPRTEEQLFDPSSFDRRALARDVAEFPTVEPDDLIYPDEEFGPMGWLLMLGEQIDTRTAMKAALGWGGDRTRAIEDDGRVCVELRFIGDSESDEQEMYGALRAWRRAIPHGDDVDVRQRADFVEVRACDPGADVSGITTDRSEYAFGRQIQRLSFIEFALTDAGFDADLDEATCIADGIAFALTDDELQADDLGPASTRAVARVMQSCLPNQS